MTLQPSWPGVTGLASTTATRKNLAGLIETDTSGNARGGVFPAHLNALVTARSDMNVDIAAFQAAAVQFGGPILISNDGTIQLPSVLVSPASGTNYYVVYVKQNESTSPGTDANNNLVAGAALSTVSFAAARGSLPTGALELATVQMPSGKTSTNASGVTITPTFQYTAAEGGVVMLRSQTEQDAWTPSDGSWAYRIDEGVTYRRTGGAWVPASGPFIDLIGGNTITSSGSSNVNIWSAPGSGDSVATSGWFSYEPSSGDIRVLKAGRYEIEARVAISPVSGATVSMHLIKNGTPANIIAQDSLVPSASYGGIAKLSVLSVLLNQNDTIRAWVPSGGVSGGPVTVGGTGRGLCEFRIRAVG